MLRFGQMLACFLTALSVWAQPAAPAASAGMYRMSGTVVDATTGTPLANATVALAPTIGNREPTASITTGSDGRFEFAQLAAGKYALIAQHRGYLAEALDTHEGGFSTAVVVGPDTPSADGIVFRVHRYAIISGQVLDEANEPMRHAQVMLFARPSQGASAGPGQSRNAQTDDRGTYRFSHLQPGTFYLAVSARPWYADASTGIRPRNADGTSAEASPSPLDVAYPVTFFPDAPDAASATPIILAAGERFKADIALQPVPSLHLKIRTADTDSPSGTFHGVNVQQRIFGTDVYVQATSTRNEPGVLEVSGIAPGQYEFTMTSNDGKGAQTASRIDIHAATSAEIDAANKIIPDVTVSGTLQFEQSGSKAALPSVFLRNIKTNRGASAQIAANGEFKMPQGLPPGRYAVILPAPQIYLKSLTASGAHVVGHSIDIANEPVKLTLVAGMGMASVSGIVQRDSKPMAGAMVILVPENPAGQELLFRRDQSDSDGSFEIPAVVPGRYVAIALARWDIAWQDPEVLKRYLPQGQIVEVRPRSKQDVGKITVQ